ncbi:arginine--tRNA ligase [Pseudonocardia sp. GCM10023141]|uniref:arginine--tRNA ligase domain-containing protein n=1 Tax=Pseudonocardia sp. GCM10023141 TaxID=3252653 RepID=UPI003611183F
MGDVAELLADAVVAAVHTAWGVRITSEQALIRPSGAEHGADYQSNVAMSLAKRLGRPSREIAAAVAGAVGAAGLIEPPARREGLARLVDDVTRGPLVERAGSGSRTAPTHLAMVFAAATEASWLDEGHRAVHVAFGSVLGADGRMLRTRSGETVTLIELLTRAVEHAGAIVARARSSRSGPTSRAAIGQHCRRAAPARGGGGGRRRTRRL